MAEANDRFIDLVELLDRTGKIIARLLDVEAARVTPGASAAIALGIAACITGTDGEKMERLPDTDGMKNVVLIQRGHRYKYDRMVRSDRGKHREVGSEAGTRPKRSSRRSARHRRDLHPAHLDGHDGTVPLGGVTPSGGDMASPPLSTPRT